MKSLIIGKGQIGTALYEIFAPFHEIFIRDVDDVDHFGIEVLHICFPDSVEFVKFTKEYIEKYQPDLTVIHSSVGVGKTEECGDHVVYSPVRGRHPKLVSDLKIYEKFVFSLDLNDLNKAKQYLSRCNLKVKGFQQSPKVGETLKLISNVHMGVEIAWRQELERIFKKTGTSDFVYQLWEETYRDGYLKSGDMNLVRPLMRPDPIGGHCIVPCTEILQKQFPSKILDFVLESNEKKKGEAHGVA